MDHFIVSARKYRPSTFKEVVGQDSITRTLKNAIKTGQIAQAFLFTGPRGVGKTTCARILAKTINCLHPTEETEPCNTCEACTSFNTTASFNIHELDAASNNSVDDIRSLVDQVRIPPQAGKYKVYIIDEVHMLSASAFNAFLKTLEEPPAYAKFILATTEKHRIIPTILSRCQVYDFQRIRTEDISRYLEHVAASEAVEAEVDALHIIARKADGALRDALSIFDQIVSFSGSRITYKETIENLNVLDQEYYFRTVDLILGNDRAGLLTLIEEVMSRGFDGHHFIIGLGDHLRNLLMCKDARTVSLIESGESVRTQFARQALACASSFLINCLELQKRCDLDYKISSNKRLLVELSLIQMCTSGSPAQSESTFTPPSAVQEEKKKTEPLTAATVPATLPASQSAPPTIKKEEPSAPSQPSRSEPASPKPIERFTPSIKQAVRKKQDYSEAASDTNAENLEIRVTNFDLEQLMEVWNQWLKEIEPDQPSLVTALRMNSPEILENSAIRIKVENALLLETFQGIRVNLHEKLRLRLKNPSITIQPELIESTESKRPYTNREKFQAMAEMNQNLLALKETFDLDID